MRRFLFLSFLVTAGVSGATPLSEVCGQLIGNQVSECMGAAQGRWINPSAARACGKLIGGQVTACIARIAGKDYTPGEAKTCGDLIGGQVVDCMGRSGRPHQEFTQPPPNFGPPSYPEIRGELAAALEQLHAGDAGGAEARLRRLLAAMR